MMDVCVNMVLKDEKKNSLNKVVNWAEEHLQLVVLLLVLRQIILFIIILIVEVFVVLIFFGRSLGLSLFPLFLILLILHFLLGVLGDSPCLITNLLGKVDVVSDQEVATDGDRWRRNPRRHPNWPPQLRHSRGCRFRGGPTCPCRQGCRFALVSTLPCSLGCRPWVAPIRRPSHRPNPRAWWRRGRRWSRVCPSPRACCPQGHRSSHAHPTHPGWASWPQDP